MTSRPTDGRHAGELTGAAPKRSSPITKAKTSAPGRERLLDATLTSIIECGYYRSTSNEIARRADLSWGTIQHYFGTRERLMLAVLERDYNYLTSALPETKVVGTDTKTRLSELLTVVESYYGTPQYIATLQIRLHLLHDPETEAATTRAAARHAEGLMNAWHDLARRALGGNIDDALSLHIFTVMRSVATGNAITDQVPSSLRPIEIWDPAAYRSMVLTMLCRYVEDENGPILFEAQSR